MWDAAKATFGAPAASNEEAGRGGEVRDAGLAGISARRNGRANLTEEKGGRRTRTSGTRQL